MSVEVSPPDQAPVSAGEKKVEAVLNCEHNYEYRIEGLYECKTCGAETDVDGFYGRELADRDAEIARLNELVDNQGTSKMKDPKGRKVEIREWKTVGARCKKLSRDPRVFGTLLDFGVDSQEHGEFSCLTFSRAIVELDNGEVTTCAVDLIKFTDRVMEAETGRRYVARNGRPVTLIKNGSNINNEQFPFWDPVEDTPYRSDGTPCDECRPDWDIVGDWIDPI